MMHEVLYWMVIVSALVTTAVNLADMRKRRRCPPEESEPSKEQIAKWTGLSPLQVQVALDDGIAAFYQRMGELKPTKEDS